MKKFFLLPIVAILLTACHSVKTPSPDQAVLKFLAPESFTVKKMALDAAESPRLYWTLVYSGKTATATVGNRLSGKRSLREFNVLCAFDEGNRIFYKEFYDLYEPGIMKKGFATQVNGLASASAPRFYWYHVVVFSQGEGVAVKHPIISEDTPFKIDYDAEKVDILSERLMSTALTERGESMGSPLSRIDSWVDQVKKQKINKPF